MAALWFLRVSAPASPDSRAVWLRSILAPASSRVWATLDCFAWALRVILVVS